MTFLSPGFLDKNSTLLKFSLFILVFLLFWIKGTISLDPDFGWHLKMGELILEKGIPKTDPFSYTMPSFPFVDHEWLTNLIVFKLYQLIGNLGLSFIFAFFALFSLILLLPKKKFSFTFGPFLLAVSTILPFSGIRPQEETWVLLAILLKIVLDFRFWEAYRLFLPVYFIVWANLHGGFALGIVILAIVITVKILREKKFSFSNLLLLSICFLSTTFNPYGVRIWDEVWMQISDGSLRFTIAEWIPSIFRFDIALLTLITLSCSLIFRYRAKFSLEEKTLFIVLLILGISSQRHIPLWTIMALPLTVASVNYLHLEVANIRFGLNRFNKILKLFLITCLLIFLIQNSSNLYYSFKVQGETHYPNKAAKALIKNNIQGEIFSPYDWGGYLIWKLPGKKLFIDGRMPSWRWELPNNHESNNAYKDYRDLVYGNKDLKQTFEKYNIKTVLWFTPSTPKKSLLLSYLERANLDFLVKPFQPYTNNFTQRIKDLGFREIYKDSVASIYQKG